MESDYRDSGFWIALGLLAVLVIVGLYDTMALFSKNGYRPVSYWIKTWSAASPLLPLAAGVLIGHLWFGQTR